MTHRHTKSCKHTRKSGGKHHHTKNCKHNRGRKHHHTKNCKHTKGRKHTRGGKHTKGRKHTRKMKGGNSDYLLGVKEPVSNFDFNAASYGSNTIPTSNPVAFPFGENSMSGASMSPTSMSDSNSLTGGRRRRSRRHSRKHRGGMGYSFLPPGSELTAKDSYLANVTPYSVYNE